MKSKTQAVVIILSWALLLLARTCQMSSKLFSPTKRNVSNSSSTTTLAHSWRARTGTTFPLSRLRALRFEVSGLFATAAKLFPSILLFNRRRFHIWHRRSRRSAADACQRRAHRSELHSKVQSAFHRADRRGTRSNIVEMLARQQRRLISACVCVLICIRRRSGRRVRLDARRVLFSLS